MKKLLKSLWWIITRPFVWFHKVIAIPFKAIRNAREFLNRDLEDDNTLLDTFASIATEEQARESLWGHVEDLRAHLLRTLIVLSIGIGISFYFAIPLMEYLAEPVGGLKNLQAIEVTEELGVFMRVALTSGIAIMLPYIVFEIWLFAAPGLKPRERKMGLAGIPFATVLFLSGMAFTFYFLLPTALPFLGSFTTISEFWTAREYFGFISSLMLWIGLFFEFPLIIYILTSIGLVKPGFLAQQWRVALIIIAVIAAAITPTVDPVNMALVMLPLTVLYFISIGLSYIAYASRRRKAEQLVAAEEKSV